MPRLVEHRIQCAKQLVVAHTFAVFDLQSKSTKRAQPLYCRRWKHIDERLLDATELLVQRPRDVQPIQRLVAALAERLQPDEDHTGVGAVTEAANRQSGKLRHVGHRRVLLADLRLALHHGFGAIKRRSIRELRNRYQVLLVLHGNESGRHLVEAECGQCDQRGIERQHQGLTSQHAGHATFVALGAALKETIERAKQPTEQLIDDPCSAVWRCTDRLQQHGRKRRTQGQ